MLRCTSLCSCAAKLSIVWSGSARKTPLIQFQANAILGLDGPVDHPYSGNYLSGSVSHTVHVFICLLAPTGPHRLTFKIAGNEYRLVRTILLSHSFSEVHSAYIVYLDTAMCLQPAV